MLTLAAVALGVLGTGAASGAERQPCNRNTAWQDTDPVWSPNGEWIAFLRQQPGCDPAPTALWVVRPDGTGERRLVAAWAIRPSWSPDGSRLAVERLTRAGSGIEVVPLRAGARRVVVEHAVAPSWSPRGERIAYRGGFGDLLVHDLATGVARTVVPATVDFTPVAWSPEGTRIAYSVNTSLFAQSSHIEIVNVDGSDRRRLTEPLPLHPDYRFDDQNPVWSPSGDVIAYESNREGNWEIYTIRPDGTGHRNATQNSAEDLRPAWRAGAQELTFISDRGEPPAPWGRRHSLYLLDLATGAARHLSHDVHPYGRAAWSPSGATLAFSSGRECERWGLYVSSASGPERVSNRCRFRGTPRGDRLVGSPFKDSLSGLGGSDVLLGGNGPDVLEGGTGRDSILARDGDPDTIDCGPGRDRAVVDRLDRVRGCESVARP